MPKSEKSVTGRWIDRQKGFLRGAIKVTEINSVS